jgi:ribosome-associated protein
MTLKENLENMTNFENNENDDTGEEGLELALSCARAAIDKKGERVKILDLTEISGFTDYFVIASGTSDRQVQAIADSVLDTLKADGLRAVSVEGYGEGRWVLLDFGNIVVHVFLDALREYYDLENLWDTAPRIQIPQEFYLHSGDEKSRFS